MLFTYWKVPENERVKELPGNWQSHSLEARQEYNKKYSEQTLYDREIPRDDPALVQVVKELGERSFGGHASLSVVEIPDDVEWQIEEYDGNEWVAEKHRTWR